MAYRELSNRNDVIDSRDVIERIEELESLTEDNDVLREDNDDELAALEALAEQCSEVPDWEYGETLIRRSYFVDYCKELCEDCGYIPRDLPAFIEIDWQKTADNLEVDYTTVDFDGVEYLIRNV